MPDNNQKEPSHRELDGMTVNERLFENGLLTEFDAACRRREGQEMVRLLLKVQLSP